MKATREEAYAAINSERDYQRSRWGDPRGHSLEEWFCYMVSYANEGLEILIRNKEGSEEASKALNWARKVAALGVVAMEEHGAPRREGF